jgi:hypothetical protein
MEPETVIFGRFVDQRAPDRTRRLEAGEEQRFNVTLISFDSTLMTMKLDLSKPEKISMSSVNDILLLEIL